MDDLFWLQVLATFGIDLALSLLCGVLLSEVWIARTDAPPAALCERRVGHLRACAILLALAAVMHVILLTISFSGQRSLATLAREVPDVCSTHAGLFAVALSGMALALLMASSIRSPRARRTTCGLLLLSALCLRSDTGHAAGDGSLSVGQLLQLAHLLGMAIWSGGVMASGFVVLPKWLKQMGGQGEESALASLSPIRSYLNLLSKASTFGLSAVLLSGVAKAYLATSGSLHVVRTTPWGYVLTIKAAVVSLTILLGARNRWLLASSKPRSAYRDLVRTLRIEAMTMLAVLLLSAWLANTQPPLE